MIAASGVLMRSLTRGARRAAVLVALSASACAPPGYVYDVGNFVRPHPTHELCSLRGQVLDTAIKDCVAPSAPQNVAAIAIQAIDNRRETYESDRAWSYRIERGACSRLRDRRTDLPADIAECRHDYATQPLCMSYKGFASTWFEMADNPPPVIGTLAFQANVINTLGSTKANPDPPSYYVHPQYRDMLHRLLNVAFSPDRKKWGNREHFADYAYRNCMEGRPL
jgi:hypothetical protein